MSPVCRELIRPWIDAELGYNFITLSYINPLTAKLNNLNFRPLEVVSRYRDPQLQVGDNYSCLFNLRPNKILLFT